MSTTISLLLKSSWSFLCADNLLDACSVLSMLSQAEHTFCEAYAFCVPSLLGLFSLLLKDITSKRRDTKYLLLVKIKDEGHTREGSIDKNFYFFFCMRSLC